MEQRKIKFRAWDKINEYMITDVDSINFINGDRIISIDYEDREEVNSTISFDNIYILQFTGLLDRNGNEIYEGDIVSNGDNYACEVKWSDIDYAWQLIEYGNNDGIRLHTLTAYTSTFVLLGNVFENSELLNK
jgi:uncharacterized phage protein (TIGR01671 family)